MTCNYILDGTKPVPCDDMTKWAKFMSSKEIQLALTRFDGGTYVSTVFLGIDYGHNPEKPVLFETMVFRGKHDLEQWRYTDYQAALVGHEEVVTMIRNELP